MAETLRCLITGGCGFLGRGILRQAAQLDWQVTCYSRDEMKQELCRRRYPHARYIIGDVGDTERLTAAMIGHDAVIHAAAIKFVDRAELNAQACTSINVGGSMNVIEAARRAQVKRVVGISTDKAVQPVNVYGATKMIMERLFAEASIPGTTFTCVRYGNVIGSTGSVIPLFRQQLAEDGKVYITSPKMTRFWMGVDEAITLITQALETPVGSVLVPLARAMNMDDVVNAVVGADAPREIIGTRPGEKEHEYLIHYHESVRALKQADSYLLLPPGSPEGGEAFTLASHTPHYRMTPEEMRDLITDAETV